MRPLAKVFRGIMKGYPFLKFLKFSRITVRLGDRCLMVAIA